VAAQCLDSGSESVASMHDRKTRPEAPPLAITSFLMY
jgi:hypothetical protein